MGEQKGGFLSRLKAALLFSNPSDEAEPKSESLESGYLDEDFAEKFTEAGGKFAYCISDEQLIGELQLIFQDSGWKNIFCISKELNKILMKAGIPSKDLLGLEECQATFTKCESLLADTGNIVMSARVDKSRQLKACPDTQLVLAYTSQLAANENQAMQQLKERYGSSMPASITQISPPKAVNESEDSLIKQGANSPKEIYLFLIESGEL